MTVVDKNSDVVAVCEVSNDDYLKKVSYEIISEGRKLADKTGGKLIALILSEMMVDVADIYSFGAHNVVFVKKEKGSLFNIETDAFLTAESIKKLRPSIVLFGATDYGRILAPKVAAICRCGITADCTDFDINENGKLVQIRPALGGNILAHIISPSTMPQMASVRPSVFKTFRRNRSLIKDSLTEFSFDVPVSRKKVKVLDRLILQTKDEEKIEDAQIVVSAGLGIKNKETLELLYKFSELIGGVPGCSRRLVDSGWMPHSKQVGQSGKTVSPDIYIAIGISGASQHLAGMKTSGKIIAVNIDENADIFSVADIGFLMEADLWLKEMTGFLENRES
jgi:electron transfer flavoprotein alpha subunit